MSFDVDFRLDSAQKTAPSLRVMPSNAVSTAALVSVEREK